MLASGVAIPLIATSASAATTYTNAASTVVVNPGPTTGLTDGQSVSMAVTKVGTHSITSLTAHLCVNNPNPGGFPPGISNSAQFLPDGGFCTTKPVSLGDGETTLTIDPAISAGTLAFKVGYGTSTVDAVNTTAVSCTAASPCSLVLQEDTDLGFLYVTIPVTMASPPAAPGQVTPAPTAALTGNTATVSWTAQTANPAVTDYIVTPYIGATAQTPIDTGSTALSASVPGLTNFTAYTFTVSAKNSLGTGAQSAQSNAVTPGPAGPLNVTATSPGSGAANVAWNAPTFTTGLTGYTVTPVGGPGTCVVTGLTAACTGLTNGSTYTFSVVAQYGAGNNGQASVSGPVAIGGRSVDQVIWTSRPAGTLDIAEACANNYTGQAPVLKNGGNGGTTPAPVAPANPLLPTATTSYPGNPTGIADPTQPDFGFYPQTCDVDLGTGVLNAASTYYVASGNLNTVSVRDLRDTDTGWTVGTQITPFTSGANTFNASCLAFTPKYTELSNSATYSQLSGVPGSAASAAATTGTGTVIGGTCTGAGLAGATVMTGSATGGLGRTDLDAPLTVNIPVAAHSGTYSADLTFTVLGS
jgi:hypothetical protein